MGNWSSSSQPFRIVSHRLTRTRPPRLLGWRAGLREQARDGGQAQRTIVLDKIYRMFRIFHARSPRSSRGSLEVQGPQRKRLEVKSLKKPS